MKPAWLILFSFLPILTLAVFAQQPKPAPTKLGIPNGLTLISQAPHAFLGQQKAFDVCVSTCAEFFAKNLNTHTNTSTRNR